MGQVTGRWIVVLVLLLAAGGRAWAQEPETPPAAAPEDPKKAMIGTWEFTNSGRDKLCTVRFRNDPVPHGMKVEFEPACAGLFGFVTQVTGWTIAANDFLRFVDRTGAPVLEFSEVESGIFEAPKPGEGILFIQKPATAAAPAPRTAGDLAGEWVVTRDNRRPICTLTLTDTPAGDDFAVRVTPPCDALVTRFGPTAWRIDGDELVLKPARGQSWRFEESEERVWRRMPASSNPILLLRK